MTTYAALLRDRLGHMRHSAGRFHDVAVALVSRPLYALYEHRLLQQVRSQAMPRHVGLILDGNRRFGRRSGITDPAHLYGIGAAKLDEVLQWCDELAINAVTLWVCSPDNLERPAEQVAGILCAVEAKLRALAGDPQIHRRQIRVKAIGRLELLPASTRAAIAAAQAATAQYGATVLTIAVGYGGHEEIADAVRALLKDALRRGLSLDEAIEQVSPRAIRDHLYLADAPELDLIIRTSGELRLSGFLLWQSAYSEFYFSDVLWPAFRKVDFLRAVRAFQQRGRRFGR